MTKPCMAPAGGVGGAPVWGQGKSEHTQLTHPWQEGVTTQTQSFHNVSFLTGLINLLFHADDFMHDASCLKNQMTFQTEPKTTLF